MNTSPDPEIIVRDEPHGEKVEAAIPEEVLEFLKSFKTGEVEY